MFADEIAVITGGARGIGRAVAEEFQKAGAIVCTIELFSGGCCVGDLADPVVLEDFAHRVIADDYGHVDYLIDNAPPLIKGVIPIPEQLAVLWE